MQGNEDLKRIAQLPIPDQYKQAIIQFLADPKNAQARQLVAQTSGQELVQTIQKLLQYMSQQEQGQPPGQPQAAPQMQQQQPPGQPSSQRVGSQSGIPVNRMANLPDPMGTSTIPQGAPQGYSRGIGALPRRA